MGLVVGVGGVGEAAELAQLGRQPGRRHPLDGGCRVVGRGQAGTIHHQIQAHVVAQRGDGREPAPRQRVDRRRRGAPEQAQRVVATEHGGGEVDDVPVDEPGGVEGVGDGRPALDEHLQHAPTAEIVEHGAEVAGQLQARVDPGPGGGPAEHDPQRVAALDVAHGQRRVVGAHGAGADEHGVALGPQAVGVGPGGVAGDPLARAVGRRGAAVDGGGELEHDVGPTGAAMGQVRRQLRGDGVGLDPDGDVDPGRPQRGDALSRPRAGRGPRCRRRRGRSRRR